MSTSTYLPSLNGVRAISILLVLGSHVTHSFDLAPSTLLYVRTFFNGYLGVNIFFVLSGFLITYLLVKEENDTGSISLRNFFLRRIFRILPVYFAFLLALLLIDRFTAVDFSTCEWITSLTLTKNFGCHQWLDGHLWSISVEEQFYLIWPFVLVYAVKGKQRNVFAISLIVIAVFFRVFFHRAGYYVQESYSFFTNMDSLMLGSVTGLLFFRGSPWLIRILSFRPQLIRTLIMMLMLATSYAEIHHSFRVILNPFGKSIQSVAAAYLIASYVYLPVGIGYRILNNKIVSYIGVLSYSIYIWQQIFFERSFNGGVALFPLNILLIMIVAFLSYNFLEQPFLKLRRKYHK